MNAIDLTDRRFGTLHVLKRSKRTDTAGRAFWICRCDCGRTAVIRGDNLRFGNTRQCSYCFGSGRKSDFIEVGD